MYLEMGKIGLAIAFLHRAANMVPKADILCNLAIAYKQSGQPDKVLKYFKKAIANKPTADILGNYAGLFVNNGTPDEAVKQANKSIKMDANCHMAHWNKALALLELGEWAEAWDEHEWGLRNGVRGNRAIADVPLWDGTNGKTIVVCGEQGMGDEIMFASMLPDLMKNNTVIFECHQRLRHLFEESFPGLICYGTREETEVPWHVHHKIDYRVSIGSLGKWFRRSRADFPGTPYIKAESVPKQKFRVGISWTGGLKPGRIAARSIPLWLWEPILKNDCEFISLQYTECSEEIAEVNKMGHSIKEFPEVKAHDYYETAKLVKSCDLVISGCTSLIHLAGSMGIPCWVMVPSKPSWRYGVTGGMPWYRSVRLYRQPEGGKEMWHPVIQRVGYDLEQLLEEKTCGSFIPKEITGNSGVMSLQTINP